MTPDQQARLAVAETEIRQLRGDIQVLRGEVGEANEKLDRIVATMEQGKGAFWLFLKAAAAMSAIVAGATWLANHVKLALPLALLLAAGVGAAQTPHDRFHYVYEGWLTAAGGSCCNDQDCAPTEGRWRFGPDGYEVKIGGDWRKVPPLAVRPYTSPDGDAHVCVWNGNILCFVPGSGA